MMTNAKNPDNDDSATDSITFSTSASTLVRVGCAEAVGGIVAGILADTVLYAIDSAKIMQQQQQQQRQKPMSSPGVGQSAVKLSDLTRISVLFRGVLPTVLLGSVPVFGTFFFLYAPLRHLILERQQQQEQQHEDYVKKLTMEKIESTLSPPNENDNLSSSSSSSLSSTVLLLPLASAFCSIPAIMVGVPADTLKKRLLLAQPMNDKRRRTVMDTLVTLYRSGQLWTGWQVNLIRDIPFAAIKLTLYEGLVHLYRHHLKTATSSSNSNNNDDDGLPNKKSPILTSSEVSLCGLLSGVLCGILTCPLDVLNTRLKAGGNAPPPPNTSIIHVLNSIVRQEGIAVLWKGVVLRSVVLGVGSLIFWPTHHAVTRCFLSIQEDDDDDDDESVVDLLEEPDMPLDVYR